MIESVLLDFSPACPHWPEHAESMQCFAIAATLIADDGGLDHCAGRFVQWFAQCHGLTAAEARVLEVLCAGITPRAAALHLGVGLATVRTQIGCIRAKAGADSMRTLVQQVAKLPPMVSMLRASRSDGAAHKVLPLRLPHAEFQSSIARTDRIGAAV